jgi:hypothetical protein
LFSGWLDDQKRIEKQALDLWLLRADPASRSQMLLQVKSSLAKNIGKRFRVDPANQDITLVGDLLALTDLIDIRDIVSELIAPKLLMAL